STGPCCEKCRRYAPKMVQPDPRCEDCGHPMSEGTWDGVPLSERLDAAHYLAGAEAAFVLGVDPGNYVIHYSSCDEWCRHGGPGRHRWLDEDYLTWQATNDLTL